MERLELESKILKILLSINHPITSNLEKNLNLFSLFELTQIYDFLSSGNLSSIYQFLEDKKKEYEEIINNLKIIKQFNFLNNIKINERLEMQKQQKEIENLEFNF
ncbi:MAG: hypothetical protein PHE25_01095 [Candidatus Gracilibacteria bacterium]|nr:hypothetical protein [Candidatus Gracilibacteria bacterium]